jgi:hypothetical protein
MSKGLDAGLSMQWRNTVAVPLLLFVAVNKRAGLET